VRFTGTHALLVVVMALLAPPARAEKAPMSPEALRRTATHVVTAEVVAVYTRTAVEGMYRVTRHVAEIRVREVEKGEGIDREAPLYVRYWTQQWVGPGMAPPGTNGHRGLPSPGDVLRIYLARNAYDGFTSANTDGGFNVIGANGFEKLPATAPAEGSRAPSPSPPEPPRRPDAISPP